MDNSFDLEDRRRTMTISKPAQLFLYESGSESHENYEDSLNHTMCDNSLTNERGTQEDEHVSESEEDIYCDQLRGMKPEHISQLLNKLELNDVHLESAGTEKDNQIHVNNQEIPQKKKGNANKVKNEPKKTRGKKANKLESYDKEKLLSDKPGTSKEETAKSDNLKRGQKDVNDVNSLNSNDSTKTVVNLKIIDPVPPEIINNKKPNKSKGKKANEFLYNQQDYKEGPLSFNIEVSTEETAKTVKPKRGQKEIVTLDSEISNDSNKAVENSSTDSVTVEVLNDKKTNKPKKGGNGKGNEVGEENVLHENLKDNKTTSKSKIQKTNTNLTDQTTIKDKNPSSKKKQDAKEVAVKSNSSKSTKKTVNETVDLKDSNGSLEPSTNEKKHISSRTRANKNPSEVKVKGMIKGNDVVKEKFSDKSRKNPNQTDKELPKEKETLLEKVVVEKPVKKGNSSKPKKTVEDSENKENMAKNTKGKAKREPTKKEKLDAKENPEEGEKIVTKRAARKIK